MRSYWFTWVGPNTVISVKGQKRDTQWEEMMAIRRQRQKLEQCRYKSRNVNCHQKLDEARNGFCPRASRGNWPYKHFDFRLPASGISILLNLLEFVLWPRNMIYHDKCSVRAWEKLCILLRLNGVFYVSQVVQVSYPHWFSVYLLDQLPREKCWNLQL